MIVSLIFLLFPFGGFSSGDDSDLIINAPAAVANQRYAK
jgi:hypothetical protein